MAIIGATGCQRSVIADGTAEAPAWLYVSLVPPGQELRVLDPNTLLDQSAGATIPLETPAENWVLSADGSTLVGITNSGDLQGASGHSTIIVRDARTLTERNRYPSPAPVRFPRLSRDGSRLLIQQHNATTNSRASTWYLLGTENGQLLGTLHLDEFIGNWHTLLDPAGRRLYRLVIRGGARVPRPSPLTIVAYDLERGLEVARVELSDVLAGAWESGNQADGEPLFTQLSPGVAVSPDGRRLAVVAADADRVTLVDAETLKVQRTIAAHAQAGVLSWLPLVPRVATAKSVEHAVRNVAFSHDGRRLYLWGQGFQVEDSGSITGHDLGLKLIDLDRGGTLAETRFEEWIHAVHPTGDGRSVYVAAGKPNEDSSRVSNMQTVFRRLDAASLDPRAEREFPGSHLVVLGPSIN